MTSPKFKNYIILYLFEKSLFTFLDIAPPKCNPRATHTTYTRHVIGRKYEIIFVKSYKLLGFTFCIYIINLNCTQSSVSDYYNFFNF